MFELIAFDADDTLWVNEPRYRDAGARLAEMLAGRVPFERVEQVMYDTEVRNIEVFGYGVKAFTLSMIETAAELGDGAIGSAEIAELVRIGKRMIDGPIELLDGVEQTLAALADEHPLMLLTKGDSFEQTVRIRNSGVAHHFRHVEIVPRKDPDTYRDLLRRHAVAPARFAMIGNSLRSDVLPVASIGGTGIHLPYVTTWEHERVDDREASQYDYEQVNHIGEVPALLRALTS